MGGHNRKRRQKTRKIGTGAFMQPVPVHTQCGRWAATGELNRRDNGTVRNCRTLERGKVLFRTPYWENRQWLEHVPLPCMSFRTRDYDGMERKNVTTR